VLTGVKKTAQAAHSRFVCHVSVQDLRYDTIVLAPTIITVSFFFSRIQYAVCKRITVVNVARWPPKRVSLFFPFFFFVLLYLPRSTGQRTTTHISILGIIKRGRTGLPVTKAIPVYPCSGDWRCGGPVSGKGGYRLMQEDVQDGEHIFSAVLLRVWCSAVSDA
jgi:hypothetical protein